MLSIEQCTKILEQHGGKYTYVDFCVRNQHLKKEKVGSSADLNSEVSPVGLEPTAR